MTERVVTIADMPDISRDVGLGGFSAIGSVGDTEKVAYAVLFLASPRTEHLTGTIPDVNGTSYLRTYADRQSYHSSPGCNFQGVGKRCRISE
jgi:hypothetical protein